jgi:hypothetical protein
MFLDDIVSPLTVAEAKTDYEKRRQRERDVDAGRPVKPVPKNPQTDYARKRAREKKELELGEETVVDPVNDNFTPDDLKSLERIRDLPTLKARAKELIKGKPVKRMKPEKIAFFYNRVDELNSPLAIIKMLYDMLLAGEGHKVIGSKSSMNPNSYRARFGESEARLSVGDPVIIVGNVEFEGATGDIREFSPSGKFVVVDLYNHGQQAFNSANIEYNQYADKEDDEGVEEGIVISGPGKEVNDKTVRKMVWDILKINADTGEQAIQRALSVLANKKQSRAVQNLQDKLMDLKIQLARSVDESTESSPVAGAITRRILMQHLDLLKQYGPELVGAAVDEVADYVGDVEEIGSSDVSGWVMQVERMLKENPPEAFREGFQDFNKVEPYEVCLAGKPVKTFDYYEDARRFHDNWKKKLYAQGEQAKADKITLNPIMKEAANPAQQAAIAIAKKKEQSTVNELSTEKLAQYKTAAGKDASAADKAGNFERGNKRFRGIVKATIKQGDNDAKKKGVTETGYQHGFADPKAPKLGSQEKQDFKRAELQHELGHETNNIQIYINGKPWKVVPGKGLADSREERAYLEGMKRWAEKKSATSGKTWTVGLTGANVTEGLKESYWTKLQNERNTKIASLVNELKESVKK